MKTLQEKYNGVINENFSKKQFVRDARLELPNLITQFNGFEDTIAILKNRGMIQEAKKQETPSYDKPAPGFSIETLQRGIDAELQGLGIDTAIETPSVEQYEKASQKAHKNLEKDPNHYLHLLSGDSKKVDKHDKYVEVKKNNHVDTFNGLKKAELREMITKLVREKKAKKDYDKDGKIETPEEEYKGSKDNAIKKAKKVNERVGGLQDFISLIQDRAVDSEFPEEEEAIEVIEAIADHYGIKIQVGGFVGEVNEGRRRKMKGGKVVTENDYETGGYVESMGPMLDKALKQLIAVWDEWKEGPMTEPEMVPHAKKDLINFINNQIKEQDEVNEQYFDDLEAAKEYARKESEEGFVQHVNKNSKGGFKVEDWLDGSNTVASYEGGTTLEEGFSNSISVEKTQLKEAFKAIITKVLAEEVITEAATGNLSKMAATYDDFEGMQSAINALENIVTDVESYYGKTKEKIQKVYDNFKDIKNPEGLAVGAMLGPAIESAFRKDLMPVTEKGFTKGLEMPKVNMLKPGDIAEEELEEKETVFKPVTEGKKYKYTKRQK